MHKAGRYTAALLLVLVGGTVIADKVTGTSYTAALVEWWPLLFIFLGVEYILFNMKYGDSERQLKLDLWGIIFAVMISAVVIVSTQPTGFFKHMDGFDLSKAINSIASQGQRFDKAVISIPLSPGTENIRIGNPSGDVVVRSGPIDEVRVETTVIVNAGSEQEGRAIADESGLEYGESGDTLHIQAVAKEYSGSYFGNRKPRMNLVVTLPEKVKANLELQLENGKILASGLPIKERFAGETTNGEIQVSGVEGELRFKTSNGAIQMSRTAGRLTLETSNGRVELTHHEGDAVVESTNGEIRVTNTSGAIQTETSNGAIIIDGATKGLKARTSNGSVEVSSLTIDGDWDVETSHGRIDVKLPSGGDYRIEGEGKEGDIQTGLPLTVRKDTVTGTVGSGKHRIKLDTNGSLSIQEVH